MKYFKLISFPCVCLVIVSLFFLKTWGAAAAPVTTTNCGHWNVVKSPSPNTNLNILNGVAAVSSNNAWAVGYSTNSSSQYQYPSLIEHWNGQKWGIIPSPDPSHHSNILGGIVALSANDIWAVGDDGYLLTNTFHPFIVHWDGSRWNLLPTQQQSAILYAVSAVSANDIWAVGYNKPTGQTITEHWNGSLWSIVPSPNPTSYHNFLTSVTAVSSNNVWAVGYYQNPGLQINTLVEHWNGSQWTIVKSANLDSSVNELDGVTAISATNIWAVGQRGNIPLIEHWNGSTWSAVRGPIIFGSFLGTTAISTGNIWAVGLATSGALIEHFNGTKWSLVSSPNPSDNILRSVAYIPGTTSLWSAGDHQTSSSNSLTLTEYYC